MSFIAVHVLTAVLDSYVSIPLASALVPFTSGYERLWLGLGAVSLDLMLAVIVTSLVRGRLSRRLWRGVHLLAYVSWPVALAHGIGASGDLRHGRLSLVAVGCTLLVLGAVAWRVSAAAREVPRAGRVAAVFRITQHGPAAAPFAITDPARGDRGARAARGPGRRAGRPAGRRAAPAAPGPAGRPQRAPGPARPGPLSRRHGGADRPGEGVRPDRPGRGGLPRAPQAGRRERRARREGSDRERRRERACAAARTSSCCGRRRTSCSTACSSPPRRDRRRRGSPVPAPRVGVRHPERAGRAPGPRP